VGCGPRGDVRAVLANAGYRWVGVDWEAAPATYLADVHALPFRDGAFALVASDAVLEHVRYPHLGIAEMARVLRPGGVMVGEVAFLQPFHASYFHMTHEAILDLVRYAGLEPTLYAGGATSSFLYLARKAVRRWAWLAWPVARAFRTVARRRGGDHDIHFACSVLFAARKPS
jgi:ubiquinone/menaquinone biosynthesis C-methylase UbiE